MAITVDSISEISRICRIAVFIGDGLVKALLKLDKAINEKVLKKVTFLKSRQVIIY